MLPARKMLRPGMVGGWGGLQIEKAGCGVGVAGSVVEVIAVAVVEAAGVMLLEAIADVVLCYRETPGGLSLDWRMRSEALRWVMVMRTGVLRLQGRSAWLCCS